MHPILRVNAARAALAATLLWSAVARGDEPPRAHPVEAAAGADAAPSVAAAASVAVLNRYVFRGWRYGAA
ncbi:MAG TPA: hypothetical protein VD838_07245, partial [Anaeromyxobacteraceae bacterium]|nr:hypothetical protein [Anaeromyxobacteraceae bacterium]